MVGLLRRGRVHSHNIVRRKGGLCSEGGLAGESVSKQRSQFQEFTQGKEIFGGGN